MITSIDMTTTHASTVAAPRPRTASPFGVSAAPAWLPAVSTTAGTALGMHADQALQAPLAARVVPNPKVRVAGIGTKQDRPPRGELR